MQFSWADTPWHISSVDTTSPCPFLHEISVKLISSIVCTTFTYQRSAACVGVCLLSSMDIQTAIIYHIPTRVVELLSPGSLMTSASFSFSDVNGFVVLVNVLNHVGFSFFLNKYCTVVDLLFVSVLSFVARYVSCCLTPPSAQRNMSRMIQTSEQLAFNTTWCYKPVSLKSPYRL